MKFNSIPKEKENSNQNKRQNSEPNRLINNFQNIFNSEGNNELINLSEEVSSNNIDNVYMMIQRNSNFLEEDRRRISIFL